MASQPTDDEYSIMVRDILLAEPIRGLPTQPSRLLDHVFIGSQSNAESLRLLRSLNVTHVLNCAGYKGPRPTPDASPYEGLGIDYYEFQAEDTDRYNICQHFAEAFTYLDRVHRQRGVALVHCALGINRSAAVCLGYIMVHTRMPLLEATKLLKERRCVVLANKHFQRLLVKFARSRGLLDKITVSPLDDGLGSDGYKRSDNGHGYKKAHELFGPVDYLKSSRKQDIVRYDPNKDFDIPTFNSSDSPFNGYGSTSNGNAYSAQNGTKNSYSLTNGIQNGSVGRGDSDKGRLNNIYKDIFDRFDKLAESLKTAGKVTGLIDKDNDDSAERKADNYLSISRRAQSTTALPNSRSMTSSHDIMSRRGVGDGVSGWENGYSRMSFTNPRPGTGLGMTSPRLGAGMRRGHGSLRRARPGSVAGENFESGRQRTHAGSTTGFI